MPNASPNDAFSWTAFVKGGKEKSSNRYGSLYKKENLERDRSWEEERGISACLADLLSGDTFQGPMGGQKGVISPLLPCLSLVPFWPPGKESDAVYRENFQN